MGHHRPASETPLKWRFAGGPTMLGIQTSIVKKPYIFVLFQGGPDHLSPSGSAHAPQNKEIILILIDRPLARNLSSGLELRGFRPCQTRIKLLRQTYRKVKHSIMLSQRANNKGADQTLQMCRPVCPFVVRMQLGHFSRDTVNDYANVILIIN